MEQGPKIIDFLENKRDREKIILSDKYIKSGDVVKFTQQVDVFIMPPEEEMGGGANIPYSIGMPEGEYECVGFDSETMEYKFMGQDIDRKEFTFEFRVKAQDLISNQIYKKHGK